jgi:hypothetical protein
MRTVTFADRNVVDLLNEKFVVVWNNHNVERNTKGFQATYSPVEMAAYPEGGGGRNLYTIVAAPDGTLLHTMVGYWSATMLLGELDFSLGLTLENRLERHAVRATALRAEAAKLLTDHPQEAGKRVKESPTLRRKAALELMAGCHVSGAFERIQGVESWLSDIADATRTRVHV